MSSDLYLSYSGRKAYLICPKRYKLRYIDGILIPSDPENTIFGATIGKIFEWFYNNRLWLSDAHAAVISAIEPAIEDITSDKKFDPMSHPDFMRELRADLHEFVPAGLETIRKHGLLSINSRAEVKLHVTHYNPKFGLTLRLGGYADFVHIDGEQVWILDGKGSKWREQYIDIEQVIWYAVQFYLKFHIAPTRLGFIHWRFPEDPVQWVMYDEQSIRNSLNETFQVARNIKSGLFDAKTSGECRLCSHKDDCKEGKQYLATRRVEANGRIKNSIFGIEEA